MLGGLVYLSGLNRVDVSGIDTDAILSASQKSGNIADHVFGNKNSKVIMVEYGDFQCPGCEAAYPTLKSISEKYQGQIAFVFRNFPLTDKHPNAKAAAAAAEAASLQGKYWEMHNKLYDQQSNWENLDTTQRTAAFVRYAQDLGINIDTFKKDLGSDAVNQKITFDQALGRKASVDATPTIMLNGKKVDEYVKDGKLVDQSAENAQPIWADTNSFDTLLVVPLLKQNNIPLPA